MDITADELRERLTIENGICIIDVRDRLEFHTYNIGGENIPLGALLAFDHELSQDKDEEIIVVCQRGLRSETARRFLAGQGYSHVKNLAGGLLAWRKAQH